LTVSTLEQLAQVFGQQARYRDAEAMRREVLEIRLRTLGHDNASTAIAMGNLAQNLINQNDLGKRPEAERLLIDDLAVQRRMNGERHRLTSFVRASLGDLYSDEGRYAEAEALLSDATDGMRVSPGPLHPTTLSALESLGKVCLKERKYAEAER